MTDPRPPEWEYAWVMLLFGLTLAMLIVMHDYYDLVNTLIGGH